MLSDPVGHFVVTVVRHAVAAVGLDLQGAGVGTRRRGAGVRVPPRAPVSTGALAKGRGVHFLELRVAPLAHGEQAAGLLMLTSYFLQSKDERQINSGGRTTDSRVRDAEPRARKK